MADHHAVTPRYLCWLAQQAAEKALKAALIYLRVEFARRHDLDVLCNLLPDDWKLKANRPDLAELTEWAVEARYPGDWPEATPAEAAHAIDVAAIVVESVQADLERLGFRMEALV